MKNNSRANKIIAIFFAVIFVAVSFSLVGCSTPTPAATQAPASSAGSSATTAPTAAPAANLPTIKYYMMEAGSAAPDELAKVQDAVNTMVSAKIGANVELHALSLTDVTTKMPLMLSSGNDFDLLSVNSTFCSYATVQQTGGLLALDDLLPSVTPTLNSFYDAATWNATRINGKIYMVPCYNPSVSYAGVWVPQDLLTKYNFDWTKCNSWEDWGPFMDDILKNEQGVTPMSSTDEYWGQLWFPDYYGYDSIPGISAPKGQPLIVVKADDPTRTVVAAPFTDEFKAACVLDRDWYNKGYLAKTPPTEDQFGINKRTGKVATFLVPFVADWDTTGMAASEWNNRSIVQARIEGKKNIISTGGVIGSGLAIPKASQHPQEALKFIQEMFTNTDLVNLLNWGIQGTDWVWKDQANKVIAMPDGVTASNAKYYPNTSWQFGNCTLSYFTSATGQACLQKTLDDIKNDSIQSVIMGFNPDLSSLKTQIANVSNVDQEYGQPLEKGLVDVNDPNRGLAVFQQQLKAAGIDTIVSTLQQQINAWAAQNSK